MVRLRDGVELWSAIRFDERGCGRSTGLDGPFAVEQTVDDLDQLRDLGDDDPRPWTASDSRLAASPNSTRTVLTDAGHAPWVERPADMRRRLIGALQTTPPPPVERSRSSVAS